MSETTADVITGDVSDAKTWEGIEDESVQCCVTSPPYWGLRDYQVDGQLGLEKTPEEYVAKMVQVFGFVRQKLRKDGVLWLNLGDSFSVGKLGRGDIGRKFSGTSTRSNGAGLKPRQRGLPDGLKPKDLCGIPWRVAFALQADGWWLRSDVIWNKPNQYIFLLTKSAKYLLRCRGGS